MTEEDKKEAKAVVLLEEQIHSETVLLHFSYLLITVYTQKNRHLDVCNAALEFEIGKKRTL